MCEGGDSIKRPCGFVFPKHNRLEVCAHVLKGWPHPMDEQTCFCSRAEEVLYILPLTCVWMDGPLQDGRLCLALVKEPPLLPHTHPPRCARAGGSSSLAAPVGPPSAPRTSQSLQKVLLCSEQPLCSHCLTHHPRDRWPLRSAPSEPLTLWYRCSKYMT